jgi:hypothetical protein
MALALGIGALVDAHVTRGVLGSIVLSEFIHGDTRDLAEFLVVFTGDAGIAKGKVIVQLCHKLVVEFMLDPFVQLTLNKASSASIRGRGT